MGSTRDISGIERDGIVEFRGLTYATGDRLAAPVDVELGASVDATRFGPQAPQIGGALERLLGLDEVIASEDCLSLNVFTPARDRALRPVMVFVHGGAYVTGSGSMPWYDGGPLARRGDMVIVTICSTRCGR